MVKVLSNDRYVVEETPLTRKNNKRYVCVISVGKIHPWMAFNQEYLADSNEEVSDENEEISDEHNGA